MPDGAFHDLSKLASWIQYTLAAKSLLEAMDVDDPEETLLVALTISELSIVSFGLLLLGRIFPEFAPVASDLSLKVTELSDAQGFLRRRSLDGE